MTHPLVFCLWLWPLCTLLCFQKDKKDLNMFEDLLASTFGARGLLAVLYCVIRAARMLIEESA